MGTITSFANNLDEGDEESLNRVLQYFFEPIRGFARLHFCFEGLPISEDEIANEALLRLAGNLNAGVVDADSRAAIFRYLAGISKRVLVEQLSYWQREKRFLDPSKIDNSQGTTIGIPSAVASQTDIEPFALDDLLIQLKPRLTKHEFRTLSLYIEGREIDAIAEDINRSTQVVKRSLSSALLVLEENLGSHE